MVIPWWPDTTDEWRYRWRDQVVALWKSRGYPVVIGSGVEGAARNRGIEEAVHEHQADVLIVTDADALITKSVADRAQKLAREADGLVIPHDRYVYLSKVGSASLTVEAAAMILEAREGKWPGASAGGREFEAVGPVSVGGPTVFSTRTWAKAHGYDEEIVRAYDAAFALACGTLVGEQRRLPGDFVHLWHERPQDDPPDTWKVLRQYHRAAEEGRDAMTALVRRRSGHQNS